MGVEEYFEKWCGQLLDMKFEVRQGRVNVIFRFAKNTFKDPLIRKRVLQLLVNFSTRALDSNPAFMLRVLEHILMTWPALQPEHRLYNDAIRDLQTESMVELQRLASKMPDPLLVSALHAFPCATHWADIAGRTSMTNCRPRCKR